MDKYFKGFSKIQYVILIGVTLFFGFSCTQSGFATTITGLIMGFALSYWLIVRYNKRKNMSDEERKQRQTQREKKKAQQAKLREEKAQLKSSKKHQKEVQRQLKRQAIEENKQREYERKQILEEKRSKQVKEWQTEDLTKRAQKVDGLILKKNEYCYLAIPEKINWKEQRTKSQRINYSGLTGSVHIAKGINYRLGSIKTQSKKENYVVNLFTGALFLTNKRIILVNHNGSKAYTFTRLLKFTPYSDGVILQSSAGKQVILDGFSDARQFNIYLSRLTTEDNVIPTIQGNRSENPDKTIDALRQLKVLVDEGVITEEEFAAKKKQLLGL